MFNQKKTKTKQDPQSHEPKKQMGMDFQINICQSSMCNTLIFCLVLQFEKSEAALKATDHPTVSPCFYPKVDI